MIAYAVIFLYLAAVCLVAFTVAGLVDRRGRTDTSLSDTPREMESVSRGVPEIV